MLLPISDFDLAAAATKFAHSLLSFLTEGQPFPSPNGEIGEKWVCEIDEFCAISPSICEHEDSQIGQKCPFAVST
jgi:hypothetical protein